MFARLYWGELRKQTSKSVIITLLVITAVLLLLTAVLFDSVNDLIDSVADDIPPEEGIEPTRDSYLTVYTPQSVEEQLTIYRALLDGAEREKEELGFDYYRNPDAVYHYKGQIAMLEYIRDNELYGVELAYASGLGVSTGARFTAETFVTTVGTILLLIVIIYAAIVAGGTFADEFKRGTVKMLFIRPSGRGTIVTAKLVSALTHSIAAYTVMFALTAAVGYAVFPASGAQTIYSFNNSAFTVSSSSNILGIMFATNLIEVLTYAVIAFAAGALTRNKVFGIVAPIILIEVVGMIISMFGLGRFFITDAADWSQFVGVSNLPYGGANFFISLPVWIIWTAALTVSAYLAVIKRDAA